MSRKITYEPKTIPEKRKINLKDYVKKKPETGQRLNELTNEMGTLRDEETIREMLRRTQELHDELYCMGKEDLGIAQAVHTLRWCLGLEYPFNLQSVTICKLFDFELIESFDKTKNRYDVHDLSTGLIFTFKRKKK